MDDKTEAVDDKTEAADAKTKAVEAKTEAVEAKTEAAVTKTVTVFYKNQDSTAINPEQDDAVETERGRHFFVMQPIAQQGLRYFSPQGVQGIDFICIFAA